jgi:hypothetical protein
MFSLADRIDTERCVQFFFFTSIDTAHAQCRCFELDCVMSQTRQTLHWAGTDCVVWGIQFHLLSLDDDPVVDIWGITDIRRERERQKIANGMSGSKVSCRKRLKQ